MRDNKKIMGRISALVLTLFVFMSLTIPVTAATLASTSTGTTLKSIQIYVGTNSYSPIKITTGKSFKIAGNITVTAKYSDGSSKDITSNVSWSIVSTAVAKLPGDGTIVGVKQGSTKLTATYQGVSGTRDISVTDYLQSIQINTANPSYGSIKITTGKYIKIAGNITVTAKYNDGTSKDITNNVSWSIVNTDVANLPGDGTIVGVKKGSTKLKVTYQGLSASRDITVN